MIGIINLVYGIQLDTSQWKEDNITNQFLQQNFKQISEFSRYYDSLQLSQTSYANLVRSSENSGFILIQVLDEYGNQQCNTTIQVKDYLKYSLTSTNVEGEFFFTYTNQNNSNYKIFFGFLNENCQYSRGLSEPVQPDIFESKSFQNLLSKQGKGNIYLVIQGFSQPYYLYLMIVDISVKNTYSIQKHVKLGETGFRWNLFSIQAFSDDYAVIFARNIDDKLQKIIIKANGNEVWGDPSEQGIFLSLKQNLNYIQNKAIQIENTNKYSIVTGDREQDQFTIYTFQYNGNGQLKDICLERYQNWFGNVGSFFFRYLEFGVINTEFLWIKGDNYNNNKKTTKVITTV
ncbi:hypothetical protein PPERSA_05349 [Pseudocohnilembus persalinus]|uniref:Uncharacterized protein n=1 Tax=Pseudocohnilembus persalinus TaxID=266149 RepID=A0A0V0R6W0_PSEPJ|nr:hypothetical protein PPERSA_05349 [Pseudocohnilembus persalinus]|eukprot:KRX09957.1 hypothetical protein PPERSA_05349 [Pseudocohnilembus persalinus]